MLNLVGATTMPAFPTIDLSEGVTWLQDGFAGMVTSNAGVIVGAIVIIAFTPKAFGLVKKLISKVG